MKKLNHLVKLLLLFCLIQACNTSEQGPIMLDLSTEAWIEDLDFLYNSILSKHKSPFHLIGEEELALAYDETKEKLKTLNGSEAALALSEFAALVGDGHTQASPYHSFSQFPIKVVWFQQALHLTKIEVHLKAYQGWEVLKFGKVPTSEVVNRVSRYIPKGESEQYLNSCAEKLLPYKAVLHALDITEHFDTLQLTLKNDKDSVATIQITADTTLQSPYWFAEFRAKPIYPKQRIKPLFFEQITPEGIGYFNFRSYPSRFQTFTFANQLKRWLKKEKIHTLIIDFRENRGGDFTKGRMIRDQIKPIVKAQKINVYVAIGPYTFSAGMSNASHFKNGLEGRYIGQTTGARPNGYQESHFFTLPNSNIPASCATRYFEFSDEDTPGIRPDIFIAYNWKDYYEGIDPLVNWVVEQHQ